MKNYGLVRIAQGLFLLNTVIWLGLGIFSLVRLTGNHSGQFVVMLVIGVLIFGNAAAMLLCAWGLGKQRKIFYYLALAVLAVNIVLTVTDQFGLLDLLTLLVDLALAGILIAARERFI